MNSIVCDTHETGCMAIRYLREQRYFTETFLPVESLDVHPISGLNLFIGHFIFFCI